MEWGIFRGSGIQSGSIIIEVKQEILINIVSYHQVVVLDAQRIQIKRSLRQTCPRLVQSTGGDAVRCCRGSRGQLRRVVTLDEGLRNNARCGIVTWQQ